VPSLLDENLLKLSQSSCLGQIRGRLPVPTRGWKDWSGGGGGLLTVGELKATMRPRVDWNRRRTFHHFSDEDDDSAPRSSSGEPPSKLVRSNEDAGAEPEEAAPAESASKCDGDDLDDRVTVSSSLDVAVAEPGSSGSSTELS